MFPFFRKPVAKSSAVRRHRVRLTVESLELRDCPSSLSLFDLGLAVLPGPEAPYASPMSEPVNPNLAPKVTLGGSQGQFGWWTFAGTVSQPPPTCTTVTLGGLPSLEGKTATIQPDGSFTITVQLKIGESGNASASATNTLGKTGTGYFYVHP